MPFYDSECASPSSSKESPFSEYSGPTLYGHLIILGSNSNLNSGDKGRKRSHYKVYQRAEANGVQPSAQYVVQNSAQSPQAVSDSTQHTVSYTLSRNQTVIVEYKKDPDTDLFQIGRSSEEPIDFVVVDTVPGMKMALSRANPGGKTPQSTISRFACRIIVSRKTYPPCPMLYAAGFDSSRNIFLGEKATKWQTEKGIDGLTTNGVLLMHPVGEFHGGTATPGQWREVSVGGDLLSLRQSRSSPQKGVKVDGESNRLVDGSLVDLCGATLVWRTPEGLAQGPTSRRLEEMVDALNAAKPQCPVGLNTLILARKSTIPPPDQTPYVYLNCGHVQGLHQWGKTGEERTCPICLKTGPVAQLSMGLEPAFWVDCEPPTHAFNPCGHMASEKTIKYWAQVPLPHGTNDFVPACPFCATPLSDFPGYTKLIFQDNLE